MEVISHFSHEHPLTFFEDKEFDDDEDHKPSFCNICGLPILSSPSYTCNINDCNFFLHKPCALVFPEQLDSSRHHPIEQFHSVRKYGSILRLTRELCQNFTYKCSVCEFGIHPLLAVPVEIKIKHKSHQSHPLVAICRETLSLCDACGEEHKGFFFSCQECNFWIHQDCTLLPSVVKLASHPHPFILTYSPPSDILESRCIICNRSRLLRYNGVYFCGQCGAYAHSSCAKSKLKNHETDAETRLELIQLPDEGDTFPSLVIRRYLESNPIPDQQDIKDDEKLTLIEKYHDHPLMFHDGISNSSREASLVCDVCIQPINISSPFYRCRQPECHFLVHNICANLSSSIDFVTRGECYIKASLCPAPSKFFFSSTFPCLFCHRLCNGLCYVVDDTDDELLIDIECAVAPNTIKHASHGQHVLFRTTRQSETIPLECCSGETLFHDVYRCILCDFHIHLRCALLPKRTRHKFDEHPLELITGMPNEQEHDEYNYCFCEFCEQAIDQKYWYYGCGKCKQWFHINCIPSVGYLSKVKFGGTLNISSHIHHHHVTLTRMLTVGSQRCGRCETIIQGFVDEMAFHCFECDFWIHFSCARDSAADDDTFGLKVYWEVQKKIERARRSFLEQESQFSIQ